VTNSATEAAVAASGAISVMPLPLMKPFHTDDIEIVQACQKFFFGFALPNVQLSKRATKFENRLRATTAEADLY